MRKSILFSIIILLCLWSSAWGGEYCVRQDGTASQANSEVGAGGSVDNASNSMPMATANTGTYANNDTINMGDQSASDYSNYINPTTASTGLTWQAATGESPLIDGGTYTVFLNAKTDFTVTGIDGVNSTSFMYYIYQGSGHAISDFILNAGASYGIQVRYTTGFTISSGAIGQASNCASFPIYLRNACAGTLSEIDVYHSSTATYAIDLNAAAPPGALTFSGVRIHGTGGSGRHGFYAEGLGGALTINTSSYSVNCTGWGYRIDANSQNITLTNVYSGIESDNSTTGTNTLGGFLFNNSTGILNFDYLYGKYNTTDGIQFAGAATLNASSRIDDSDFSYNTGNGFIVGTGKCPPLYDSTLIENDGDAYQANDGTTESVLNRVKIHSNGVVGDANSGDAITSHGSATGVTASFILAYNNAKTAIAWASTGNGNTVYNLTSHNNQTQHTQAEYQVVSNSPATPHVHKNCIFYNDTCALDGSGDLLVSVLTWADITANGGTYPSNNCYYGGGTSSTAYLFKVANYDPDGGGARPAGDPMTFDEYVAAGRAAGGGNNANFETGSIYEDPQFVDLANGNFVPINPNVFAGGVDVWSGVDQTDVNGKTVDVSERIPMGAEVWSGEGQGSTTPVMGLGM